MFHLNTVLIILAGLLWRFGLCEVFTSIAEMKDVVQLEAQLIEKVDNYIESEKQKLDKIDRYLNQHKLENIKALNDINGYLENPIKAYLLIKRLVVDFEKIETLVGQDNSNRTFANITSLKESPKFPTTEDLVGSTVALTRLQETYNMDTSSVARGELLGVKYTSELSASDCFQIGKQSYDNQDFSFAQSWLLEAEARFDLESDKFLQKGLILEYAALASYKLGDFASALDITNRLLEEIQNGHNETFVAPTANEWLDVFNELCKEALLPSIEPLSQIKCRYANDNHPFLRIAPFKSEEVSVRPKITMFHGIVSDDEIEVLKELSYSRLRRAETPDPTQVILGTPTSINKIAWLPGRIHKTVADVNRRISQVTGLTTKNSEPLQIVNYGIGGYYHTHFDFSSDEGGLEILDRGFGNRIATVLVYLSDVSQGGATVFPLTRAIVKPRKGSAAFWYNLHPSGIGDSRTAHGSCPVLVGSKWIANKWLYQFGQEFRRPCDLTEYPLFV